MSTGPLLEALVDDAAIFPPARVPLVDAVHAHRAHRASGHAALVGPLLVSDRSVADLRGGDGDPLDVGLVVTGGAGAIGPTLTHARRIPGVDVTGLEIALRDEDDLARNAKRITIVLDQELPAQATASIELPRLTDGAPTSSWWAAADEVAAAGHRLKFRTGGEYAEAHPSAAELVTFVDAALERETPFKLTAGLHRAVRHTSVDGFEEHGFLNVLVATRALLDGASAADAEALLEQRDADVVAAQVRAWDEAAGSAVRRWFGSFGSCSIEDPVADLRRLELLA